MIQIDLSRKTAVLILLVILGTISLVFAALDQGSVAAAEPAPSISADSNLRQYYLKSPGSAGNTLSGGGVCADGYHFASLWEILDPSNLKYNSDLGVTSADNGEGPVNAQVGWVRTGFTNNNTTTPGRANCDGWTTTSGYGTAIYLSDDWSTSALMHVMMEARLHNRLGYPNGVVVCRKTANGGVGIVAPACRFHS